MWWIWIVWAFAPLVWLCGKSLFFCSHSYTVPGEVFLRQHLWQHPSPGPRRSQQADCSLQSFVCGGTSGLWCVCVCVCVCVCARAHTYTRMHTCVCKVCVHVYMCLCVCVPVHVCLCILWCMDMCEIVSICVHLSLRHGTSLQIHATRQKGGEKKRVKKRTNETSNVTWNCFHPIFVHQSKSQASLAFYRHMCTSGVSVISLTSVISACVSVKNNRILRTKMPLWIDISYRRQKFLIFSMTSSVPAKEKHSFSTSTFVFVFLPWE